MCREARRAELRGEVVQRRAASPAEREAALRAARAMGFVDNPHWDVDEDGAVSARFAASKRPYG